MEINAECHYVRMDIGICNMEGKRMNGNRQRRATGKMGWLMVNDFVDLWISCQYIRKKKDTLWSVLFLYCLLCKHQCRLPAYN